MAQKKIHPELYPMTISLTDGTEINTYSTKKPEGKVVCLVDFKNHPAWSEQTKIKASSGENNKKVAQFNKKFGFIDYSKS